MRSDALRGKVAVVAGATRGAGRAIAVELGAAGATVYATGRSTRGNPATPGRSETIDETAEMIDTRGGHGIAVRVDHTQEPQVKALFERVRDEQNGRLDILVNDIWGGHDISEWSKPFWEQSLEQGLWMQRRAIHSHIITSHYGAPLLAARGQGLVVEVTDGVDYAYRGNLYYSLVKISTIHLAEAMAADLRPFGVTALAVTPGFLRSEEMLDHFGVTEQNWRDAIAQDPHYAESETPYYLARGVAALASDANVARKAGRVFASWDLAREYGFLDVDGRKPDWGVYFARYLAGQEP
jgi:NAD(P)-dependent dehydrogenase (short-subunit alcohol dehydrogenase family)